MAARAGALIADPEFVQFHPTAIAVGRDPAPLATEALRGEGAVLVDEQGRRFMADSPGAELAPRDVVARAIAAEIARGHKTFLDCRKALGAHFPTRFPTVYAACKAAGIDPVAQPIPVAPAAHFHMGGVAVDTAGRSSLPGLFACGEVASTGAHGANRLASNSLLEAVVMGARIAAAIQSEENATLPAALPIAFDTARGLPGERKALRQLMTDDVGLVRDAQGLRHALSALHHIDDGALAPNGGLAVVGTLIAAAALGRTESRGGHFRSDFPHADAAQAHRTLITLAEARALAEQVDAEPVREAAL
jgi:L-aspartate oxidase